MLLPHTWRAGRERMSTRQPRAPMSAPAPPATTTTTTTQRLLAGTSLSTTTQLRPQATMVCQMQASRCCVSESKLLGLALGLARLLTPLAVDTLCHALPLQVSPMTAQSAPKTYANLWYELLSCVRGRGVVSDLVPPGGPASVFHIPMLRHFVAVSRTRCSSASSQTRSRHTPSPA